MKKEIFRVWPAEPYRSCELGSMGNASCMLLQQFNFPNYFSEKDTMTQADHDRCIAEDSEHTRRCFQKHTGNGEYHFEEWAREAESSKVLAFLIDILKADKNIVWTGYRLMGSVNQSGHPIWSLQLFAKHPKSNTKVYTGNIAPNVLPKPKFC